MWSLVDMLYRFRETDLVKLGVTGQAFMGKVGLEPGSGLTEQKRGEGFLNEEDLQSPEESGLASVETPMKSDCLERLDPNHGRI